MLRLVLLLALLWPLTAAHARSGPQRDVASLERALAAAPERVDTQRALAAALLAEVRIAPRVETLARANGLVDRLLASHAPEADALDAWRLLIAHRFDAALAAARRARASDGDTLLALCSEADALTELGRYDEAEAVVQALLDRHYGVAALARASHLRRLFGDLEGAVELTDKALAHVATAEDRAWLLLDSADLKLAAGAPAGSLALAMTAVAALPEPALAMQARALTALGDGRAALALYGVLVARAPRAEWVVERLRLARELGEDALAARCAQLLSGLARLDAANGGSDTRAFVEYHLLDNRLAAAEDLARQEWRRRPDVFSAAQLGWVLSRAGKAVEAQAYARRAVLEHTADPLLQWRAGSVLAAAADAQGQALVAQALRVAPWLAASSSTLASRP